MNKDDYPKAITDLFGIPPQMGTGGYWMSRNGTVSETWVRLIAAKVGVRYRSDKVTTMQAMVEAVKEEWNPRTMASTLTRSGGGGNISKPGFDALYRGIQRHPEVIARREDEARRAEAASEARALRALPSPDVAADGLVLGAIALRRGQSRFRQALLRAYGGRCAFSGCDAEPALEAAHIKRYAIGGSYSLSNGLLLRSDLHTLFDLHLIAVADDGLLLLAPKLAATTYAEELKDRRLAAPIGGGGPDKEALRAHRVLCGL